MKSVRPIIWLLAGYMWLFIHRPFEVWPSLGDLHIERVYMVATIAYWAVAAKKQWIGNRLTWAFAFFWGVFLVSWVQSPYASFTSEGVEDYFKVALFYILVITSVRDERELRLLTVLYAVAVGVYMAHSLWEYHNGRGEYRMGTWRMVGVDFTNGDPNTFAATVVYSLTLAFPLWHECRSKWQRIAVLGYGAMAVACVLLTGSRTALVGLCLLAVVATSLSKYRFRLALLLALAVPLVWNIMPADRQNRFLTLIDPSYGPKNAQMSAEGRIQGWWNGVSLWKEHPILGVGPGAFGRATGLGFQSHHLYGQILGEVGTLGAIAFVSVLTAFVLNAVEIRRLCRQGPQGLESHESRLNNTIMLTVALLLVLGFGGHNLYRYTWLWFGALQVIALNCVRQETRTCGQQETLDDEATFVPEETPAEEDA